MTSRYHIGSPILNCPKCGKEMEIGERVKVQLGWELGSRYKYSSVGGFLCRSCAEEAARHCALVTPDSLYLAEPSR